MLRWFLTVAAAAVAISSASAAFVVSAVPSIGPGPNGAGGAFVNPYSFNAANGLRSTNGSGFGTSDAGTPGAADYYLPQPNQYIGGGNINSINTTGGGVNGLQKGIVNAAGFNGHLGNFLYMGLAAKSSVPGQLFSANQVNFNGYNYPANLTAGFNAFNLGTVVGGGRVYGANTVGGPISVVTNPATSYQELYYVGPGFSLPAIFGTDWNSPATLNALFFDPNTPAGGLSGSYSLIGVGAFTSNVGGVDVNGAPAPATFALMGLGFIGTGLVRRFRKA